MMEAAFTNQLVLQHMFSYLPLRDLKQCRFVSKDWNFEVQSYIRTFRRCDANICGKNPCSELRVLDEIASQTTALTINSLTIKFSPPVHSNCESLQNETRGYDELLKKLHLGYLCVRWCGRLKPTECPATKFVVHLLQEKLSNLHTLNLGCVPRQVRNRYFGQDWTPRLPHLKVLHVEGIRSWKDLFLKVLSAAPNLQKLTVDDETPVVDIVPKEKRSLMDNCYLSMDSAEQQIHYLEFALSLPKLSKLVTSAPSESEREYHTSYFRVLQLLLTSSCKTLQAIHMENVIFPFNHLTFPALGNLKKLTIDTGATTEDIIHVLRFIDYPTMLPALEKVEATLCFEDERMYVNPWERNAENPVQSQHGSPSTTVTHLVLEFYVNRDSLEACGRIFPNVNHVSLFQLMTELNEIPYEVLWAQWSHVEFMEITESEIELGENFDAEFLGINPEEVNLLRQMDDASLETINVVPIRPSILTMPRKVQISKVLALSSVIVAITDTEAGSFMFHSRFLLPFAGLKSLKIVFYDTVYLSGQEYPPPDQVFLSKLTGLLAFKKLTRMGAIIEINISSGFISCA